MIPRVVIADDEPAVARTLQVQLELQGYRVIGIATNGSEAVELCKKESPDIVLMDEHMPGMSGLEATHKLMKEFPVCIVVFTVNTHLDFSVDRAGAMSYVVKPLLPSQIRTILNAAQQRFDRYLELRNQSKDNCAALEAWIEVQTAVYTIAMRAGISENEAVQQLGEQAVLTKRSLLETAKAFIQNNVAE